MVRSPEPNDAVWERLRHAGLRITPLRRRLVTLFSSSGRWYTPQELSVQARKAGLRPGRATVYRLIDALVQAGLCKSFPQNTRAVRYVFCLPDHHHHLICLDCGRVRDVENCQVRVPDESFTVTEHSVDFFGRCASCDKTSA